MKDKESKISFLQTFPICKSSNNYLGAKIIMLMTNNSDAATYEEALYL